MRYHTAPTLADIEALAEAAFNTLPAPLAACTENLVIQVEDFPSKELEHEMELESAYDLLGLYIGTDLPRKSISDPHPEMDLVFLYRRPILDYWCESGETLVDIVRNTLIHEIGHHFGFSDEEMEALESPSRS